MEIQKIVWCAAAAQALEPALGDDLEEIAQQVVMKAADLWLYADGSYVVTRLERIAGQQPELVIVAGAGVDYKQKVAGWMMAARELGYSVRIHASRKGVFRWLEQLGFVEIERVYRYGRLVKE